MTTQKDDINWAWKVRVCRDTLYAKADKTTAIDHIGIERERRMKEKNRAKSKRRN